MLVSEALMHQRGCVVRRCRVFFPPEILNPVAKKNYLIVLWPQKKTTMAKKMLLEAQKPSKPRNTPRVRKFAPSAEPLLLGSLYVILLTMWAIAEVSG